MSFSLLSFQTSLAGSTICPIDSHEALISPMTSPSAIQVSVDFHAVMKVPLEDSFEVQFVFNFVASS